MLKGVALLLAAVALLVMVFFKEVLAHPPGPQVFRPNGFAMRGGPGAMPGMPVGNGAPQAFPALHPAMQANNGMGLNGNAMGFGGMGLNGYGMSFGWGYGMPNYNLMFNWLGSGNTGMYGIPINYGMTGNNNPFGFNGFNAGFNGLSNTGYGAGFNGFGGGFNGLGAGGIGGFNGFGGINGMGVGNMTGLPGDAGMKGVGFTGNKGL
jgi:hypothetical protein